MSCLYRLNFVKMKGNKVQILSLRRVSCLSVWPNCRGVCGQGNLSVPFFFLYDLFQTVAIVVFTDGCESL